MNIYIVFQKYTPISAHFDKTSALRVAKMVESYAVVSCRLADPWYLFQNLVESVDPLTDAYKHVQETKFAPHKKNNIAKAIMLLFKAYGQGCLEHIFKLLVLEE